MTPVVINNINEKKIYCVDFSNLQKVISQYIYKKTKIKSYFNQHIKVLLNFLFIYLFILPEEQKHYSI